MSGEAEPKMPLCDSDDYMDGFFESLCKSNKLNQILSGILNVSNGSELDSFSTEERIVGRGIVLLIAYGILVAVALFGNVLVCHVIFSRKRMRTVTNIFIANLAVSDLLLIVLNVPLNIAKTLLKEWYFGGILCNVMNMSLIISVYASTFTLTVIALDRQRVLLYPLRPRILKSGGMVVVAVIWIVSVILALPYGIYSETREVNVYVEKLLRCRSNFPSDEFEQYLTIVTMILQYILPLIIIAVTYGRIVRRIWERTDLGAVTEHQHACRTKHKKKSIKMLMIVVIVFALCWMPLNLYQILTKLHPDTETFHASTKAFFVCHWLAISSTCYNPFIYCWLNEAFRTEIRAVFRCCCPGEVVHPRDLRMSESVSQSEYISLQVKSRSSMGGHRGRFSTLLSSNGQGMSGCVRTSAIEAEERKRCVQEEAGASGYDSRCRKAGSWKSLNGSL